LKVRVSFRGEDVEFGAACEMDQVERPLAMQGFSHRFGIGVEVASQLGSKRNDVFVAHGRYKIDIIRGTENAMHGAWERASHHVRDRQTV